MNNRNLKPLQAGTERAKNIARKGGIASGKARREAIANGMTPGEWRREQTFAKAAKAIAGMPCCGKRGKQGMTYATACCLKLWKQAANGSVKSFHLLALLMGELQAAKKRVFDIPIIHDDIPRCDLVKECERQAGMTDRGNK